MPTPHGTPDPVPLPRCVWPDPVAENAPFFVLAAGPDGAAQVWARRRTDAGRDMLVAMFAPGSSVLAPARIPFTPHSLAIDFAEALTAAHRALTPVARALRAGRLLRDALEEYETATLALIEHVAETDPAATE